jgi:hypothetical protein
MVHVVRASSAGVTLRYRCTIRREKRSEVAFRQHQHVSAEDDLSKLTLLQRLAEERVHSSAETEHL